ncbi:MAG: hypothetical protein JRJ44_00810, partial [Deltaproteobacteria bacterium]|nr:hypothetical protein [Deltaproteobacteria bacterium]
MKKPFIYFISLLFVFSSFNILARAAKNKNGNKTIQSETDKQKSDLPYLVKVKPLKLKIFKKTSLEIAALKKAAIVYYEETGAWPLDAERLKAFGLKEWDGNSSWGTPISFYVENGEFVISNEAPDNLHEAFSGLGRIEKDKKTGKVNIHISPPDSIKIRDDARLFEQDIIISKDSPALQLEDTNLSEGNLSDANLSDANNSLSVFIMNKNGELVVLSNEKLPNVTVKQKGDVEVKGNLSAVSNTIRLKNIENEGTSLIEMAGVNNKYKAALRIGDTYKNDKKEVIPEGFQLGSISKHPVTMLVNNSPRVIIDEENLSTFNINAFNLNSGNITADNIKINKTINGEDTSKLFEGLRVLINSEELFGIINRDEKLMTETNIEDYAISVAGTGALVGDIIPAVSSKYIIGSSERSFKAGYFDHLYISGSSLYMDGIKVLSSEGAVLNGDISGTGVKTVIDENNPSNTKLASETAITRYVQEKVANISGIPGKLKLGGDFVTTGDIMLDVIGGGTAEITLPVIGTLATRAWVLEQNLSADMVLSNLEDVADTLPDTAGNMLIWDNSGILQSRALTRDVSVNQYGNATVNSIDGKPITLGGVFTTTNSIELDASKDVTVKIEESGTLATQTYVAGQIEGSNISSELENLKDTDITASDTSGDIIIWDSINKKWINRKVSQDISLEKGGKVTVKSISGKSISLEAGFKTTGAGNIEFNATSPVSVEINRGGVLATIADINDYIVAAGDAAALKDLVDTEVTSANGGDLLIWDASNQKWFNREVSGDIAMARDGGVTIKRIGGKSIALGGELITSGKFITTGGDITFNAEGATVLTLPESGRLARIEDVEAYMIAANATALLSNLIDTNINDTIASGDILVWDASNQKWFNREVSGDIDLAQDGAATVYKISGKPISLGAEFKTIGGGNIELRNMDASPVSIEIRDSGV